MSTLRELKANYPGLKWQTILWIEELRQRKALLSERGDPRKMLPNLEAIITTYESRQIDVYPDERLATHWSVDQSATVLRLGRKLYQCF
jgi:hypothetical protein